MPPAKKQKPEPSEFGPRGAALMAQYLDAYDLDPSSMEILTSAAHCADLVATLDRIAVERGPLDADGKIGPWIQEGRFQKGLLLKLCSQLERLAETPSNSGSRRNLGGTRGSYNVRRS